MAVRGADARTGRRGSAPAWLGAVAAWSADRLRSLAAAIAASFRREMEWGRGALWLPVLYGCGILLYFALPSEPRLWGLLAAAAGAVALAIAARDRAVLFRCAVVLAAIAAGTATAKLRTDLVAAPILAEAHTGILTGWIESVEQEAAREARVVVRVQSIEDLAPEETPFRVRIVVRGAFTVRVGDGISGLVALQPPAAPVMPGGYDFGRDLYYQGIGGSGFSYGPPALADLGEAPADMRFWQPVEDLRAAIGARVEAALPGVNGQIANALITGDRAGIPDAVEESLRRSGLGHILSISGLHMALVAAIALQALRALLALFPGLALRRPIKKWSAAGALAIATGYLLISGFGVATQRSYIMLAVMLVAILLDRRALSIRNIAIAAAIVLALSPESILSASFQMSFAATLALIAGFEWLADRQRQALRLRPPDRTGLVRWGLIWATGLFATSIFAGLATAPYGAFHFQRTAPLSLLANVAAAPVVSLLVMPPALFAVLLMPFGLEAIPFVIMDFGLRLMLDISDTVAGWTGEGGMTPLAPTISILVVSAGLVWLCLWRQRWRLAGLAPIAIGIGLAFTGPRPEVLIDETGTALMVRAVDGAYRFVGSGASFERETWLRADADLRPINDPSLSEGVSCDRVGCTAVIGSTGARVALVEDPRAFAEDCRLAAIVVTELRAPPTCAATALVIDRDQLRRYGAHAIALAATADGWEFRIDTVRLDIRRPWMPPLPPDLR